MIIIIVIMIIITVVIIIILCATMRKVMSVHNYCNFSILRVLQTWKIDSDFDTVCRCQKIRNSIIFKKCFLKIEEPLRFFSRKFSLRYIFWTMKTKYYFCLSVSGEYLHSPSTLNSVAIHHLDKIFPLFPRARMYFVSICK